MHEVSVVSDIVSAVLNELGKYDVEKVEEVILVVGKLTSLGVEQMEFAYEIVTKGTVLEGSKLVIESEDVILSCASCGYDGPAKELESDYSEHRLPILSCPQCGGKVKVTAGQTCRVRNISFVEASGCTN